MAWVPAIPFSKVVVTATNNYGKVWRETLGYAGVNVFNGEQDGTAARRLLTFGQGIISLTNGVYQETNLTYEVNLDGMQY